VERNRNFKRFIYSTYRLFLIITSGLAPTLIVVANSKTKLVLSESSQYSECENRIRHHYHFKCVSLLSQLQLSIFTGPTQKSKLDLSTVRQNSCVSQIYSPFREVFLSLNLLSFSYKLTWSLKLSANES